MANMQGQTGKESKMSETIKKYEVGEYQLTQAALSLRDSKKVLAILKGYEWDRVLSGEQKATEFMAELLDNDRFESVLEIAVKGLPEGIVLGDVIDIKLAFTMVNDFFDFNANLIWTAMSLSANSIQPTNQESKENQILSTEKTPIPSTQPEDSGSVKELNLRSVKEKPTG